MNNLHIQTNQTRTNAKSTETSKFDWMLDYIRKERISRFLEQHWPHFEFDSRSFNYSMPKEGKNGVIGERNDIKY